MARAWQGISATFKVDDHMTDAFQLVEPLKEARRDGLSVDSRGVAQLRKYMSSNELTVQVISGLIRSAHISDGLYFLTGAYALHPNFENLDLTRRRELLSRILGISVRTLIRKEDLAIDILSRQFAHAVDRTENGSNAEALSEYLLLSDEPLPGFEDMITQTAMAARRNPEQNYDPENELQRAIESSFQKIDEQRRQLQELMVEHEREIDALHSLMGRRHKFD